MHGINYFSANSDKKAAVVEWFNRTLKMAMWKYLYAKGSYNWTNVLDEIVSNYNETASTAPPLKPRDINKKNESQVSTTLFGYRFAESPLPV